MDHEAIRKAYPTVITIDDDSNAILDKDGATVTVEQSKIDEARVTLNAEYEAQNTKSKKIRVSRSGYAIRLHLSSWH